MKSSINEKNLGTLPVSLNIFTSPLESLLMLHFFRNSILYNSIVFRDSIDVPLKLCFIMGWARLM